MERKEITTQMRTMKSRSEIVESVLNRISVDYGKIFKSYLKSLPKIPKRKRPIIPKNASLAERSVIEVLRDVINPDNSIGPNYGHYMAWQPNEDKITLDSDFTVEELEALAWWIRNKKILKESEKV